MSSIGNGTRVMSVRTSVVRRSVSRVLTIYSKLESRKNFKFGEDMTPETSNWGTYLRSKSERSRSLGTKV